MNTKIDEILAKQAADAPTRESTFTMQTRDVDEEARTVEVAFSSETPVERWFGTEILEHTPAAADLRLLLNGAPVLVGHNTHDHIGVVESARIDDDLVGRAVLRFGKSQRANDVFNDVLDGIRQKVSVGYYVKEYVENVEDEEYRATKWEPFEISIVSLPADDTVGVGRSKTTPKITQVKEMDDNIDPKAAADKAIAQARESEAARVKLIRALGKKHQLSELADTFVENGKDVEEFRGAAMDAMEERQADALAAATPETHIDMGAREAAQYSIVRAIRAAASGNWKNAGLEHEAHVAVADKLGREARGFFIPQDVQVRAMNTQTMAAGGAMVATELHSEAFIDILRANSVIMGLGGTMLTGLVGDVDIPRLTGAETFYWIDEDEDGTDSELTAGVLKLSPKTVAGAVPMTRRLLQQTSGSVDAMIQASLAKGSALAIDLAILQGSGDKRPKGIVNTDGVNTQSISSAGAPTWAEIVGFETQVSTENALDGDLAYVTTPGVAGTMKTTKKDAGSGIFLMEGGQVNGYDVRTTSQLAANTIVFGNFSDVVIGEWGVLDVTIDESTKSASGGLVVRTFQDVDAGTRQAASFCKNA